MVHRLCASKEISNIDDICLQNEKWARSSFITDSIYNDLEKSTPAHSSLDNNNFRAEFQTWLLLFFPVTLCRYVQSSTYFLTTKFTRKIVF